MTTTTRRRWLLGVAGVAALGAGVGWRLWREGTGAPAPADDFWSQELPTPSGALLPLRSLRGRPVMVNFWATWCPPCVKEMPELDRFAREYGRRGWQVLGVAIDQPEAVQTFLQRTPVGFPIVLAGNEGLGWVQKLGNPGGGLPFTVQFSAEGLPVRHHVGPTTMDQLAQWAGTP